MKYTGSPAERVTEVMHRQCRSVASVARSAGFPPSTLAGKLDSGNLTMTDLFALTGALGVGLDDLLPAADGEG